MIFSDSMWFFDNMSDEEMSLFDEMLFREHRKTTREKFEKQHNIKRDKRGRLNKGALLAKKDTCNEDKIWLRYKAGMTVGEIVEVMGCSKSTVYNVIKKRKSKDK